MKTSLENIKNEKTMLIGDADVSTILYTAVSAFSWKSVLNLIFKPNVVQQVAQELNTGLFVVAGHVDPPARPCDGRACKPHAGETFVASVIWRRTKVQHQAV